MECKCISIPGLSYKAFYLTSKTDVHVRCMLYVPGHCYYPHDFCLYIARNHASPREIITKLFVPWSVVVIFIFFPEHMFQVKFISTSLKLLSCRCHRKPSKKIRIGSIDGLVLCDGSRLQCAESLKVVGTVDSCTPSANEEGKVECLCISITRTAYCLASLNGSECFMAAVVYHWFILDSIRYIPTIYNRTHSHGVAVICTIPRLIILFYPTFRRNPVLIKPVAVESLTERYEIFNFGTLYLLLIAIYVTRRWCEYTFPRTAWYTKSLIVFTCIQLQL